MLSRPTSYARIVESLVDNATPHKKQVLLTKGIRCGLNFAQTVAKLKEDVTKLKNKSSDQNRCILYDIVGGQLCYPWSFSCFCPTKWSGAVQLQT